MGSSNNSAADESNRLIQSQIATQQREEREKTRSLFGDELVSLKSQGLVQFESPDASANQPAPKPSPQPWINPNWKNPFKDSLGNS